MICYTGHKYASFLCYVFLKNDSESILYDGILCYIDHTEIRLSCHEKLQHGY